MGKYLEKVEKLRNSDVHYNCAQTVLMAFSELTGLTDEQAFKTAANFGGGMRSGSVCGAYTGALMAMGLLGLDTPAAVHEFERVFKEAHGGCILCKDLLAASAAAGLEKGLHCNNLVYFAVKYIENMEKHV